MGSQQFRGVLAVEGQEVNGVTFAPGALTWPDDGVLLFLGFDAGVCIGKVEQIERIGDEIRGDVILYANAGAETGNTFAVDEDGIVGFGLAVAVTLREREGDDGPITSGEITAVTATPKPALRVVGSSEGLRGHLEQAVRAGVRPPHPEVVAPVLEGRLDPTARASENRHGETISAELRSVESALAYYTVEGLFIALTPLGMIAVAHAMLQCLSGDHGELPEGITLEGLDPWGELAPFQALLAPEHEGHDHDRMTCAEECRRALWHLEQAYEAATSAET